MRNVRNVIGMAICCIVISAITAQAQVLDQANSGVIMLTQGIGENPGAFGDPTVAQSFTVGIAGILHSVDVYVDRNLDPSVFGVDLVAEIRAAAAGVPTGGALASVTIPELSVPASPSFLNVDVSSFGIPVSIGTELAIVLYNSTPTAPTVFAWHGSGGTYAGGNHSYDIGGGFLVQADDLFFRTYVIPEPSSLVLGVLGLIGLVGIHRRRK